MRKTKVICTVGPASSDEKTLEKMMLSGMDLARINTSHSDEDEVKTLVKRIRKISGKISKDVAIILDLQGPKIRVGELPHDLYLEKGQDLIFFTGKKKAEREYYKKNIARVDYSRFIDDIRSGGKIFIDDGLIECKILEIDRKNKNALCRVVTGGRLSSHKGLNLPGVSVSTDSVTRKDIEFLKLGLELEVDFIAQSFVRSPNDVRIIREEINKAKSPAGIISKIEKHEAVDAFEKILEESDAIMVARGDLGIEIDAEEVPAVQKQIIRRSNLDGKPVITATQMLNSMIENPRPTRAEVSDVANAILDGSDAVMLSGETAIGKYPLKSLDMLIRVIMETEETPDYNLISQNNALLRKKPGIPHNTMTEAISYAACEVARILGAEAIISSTESGFTARQVSKNRPCSLIIGTSPNIHIVRQLMLSWGVVPVKTASTKNIDSMIEEDIRVSREMGYIRKGDKVVITAGVMVNKPGSTNFINVREVE
jgi:pyruvate kinase